MKRNLDLLSDREFDVVVIGGGIFAACAARDAAMRGLSVALIEKADFGSGTSANSFKMVHGGIRYLQHADLVRLHQSCRERSALLRTAPHLVQPLPIVIPTYGHGKSGKEYLGAGMLLYDVLTLGRNRGITDATRKIRWSHFLNRGKVIDLFPDIKKPGLTGAAVFSDGQMYNPTRLTLAFVQSAVEHGAVAANYTEAVTLLRTGDRVQGIKARDVLTGDEFEIRARTVLNAAGPWAEGLVARSPEIPPVPAVTYSRDACFVIKRRTTHPFALAVQGRTFDPDALLSRPARHLFVVPWRNYSLVGVWHVVYHQPPDEVTVTEQDLRGFIDEINWAYPSLDISLDDVLIWNAGLVPFGENEDGSENLSYGKRSHLIDHAREQNIEGLVTLIGIRYTTARGDAARAIDMLAAKLGKGTKRAPTDTTPVYGGDIPDFERLVEEATRNQSLGLSADVMRALVHNYGTEYASVLRYAEQDPLLAETLGDSSVLKAEVVHVVRGEMAMNLSDVVFQRTDLATGGNPGRDALENCARLIGDEFGWNPARIEQEISAVEKRFPSFTSAPATEQQSVSASA